MNGLPAGRALLSSAMRGHAHPLMLPGGSHARLAARTSVVWRSETHRQGPTCWSSMPALAAGRATTLCDQLGRASHAASQPISKSHSCFHIPQPMSTPTLHSYARVLQCVRQDDTIANQTMGGPAPDPPKTTTHLPPSHQTERPWCRLWSEPELCEAESGTKCLGDHLGTLWLSFFRTPHAPPSTPPPPRTPTQTTIAKRGGDVRFEGEMARGACSWMHRKGTRHAHPLITSCGSTAVGEGVRRRPELRSQGRHEFGFEIGAHGSDLGESIARTSADVREEADVKDPERVCGPDCRPHPWAPTSDLTLGRSRANPLVDLPWPFPMAEAQAACQRPARAGGGPQRPSPADNGPRPWLGPAAQLPVGALIATQPEEYTRSLGSRDERASGGR